MVADATMPTTLPDTLRLGPVDLTVRDLDRAVAWYQRALGLRVHRVDTGVAELGDGIETTVILHEDPLALPAGRHAGLYHFALLYPSREELARAVVRIAASRTPIEGASDHETHEAIYLPDADSNGIELAADRPREDWPEHLGYAGGPKPLDVDDLLATVAGEDYPEHVGEGLRMGHLHLHVGDIEEGLAFYRDAIGFEQQALIAGSAAFVSAGGYHHHLGLNTWRGQGVPPAPDHRAGLRHWTIQLPTDADVAAVRARVTDTEDVDGGFAIRDPWGITAHFVSTTATGVHGHAVVATAKPSPYLLQLAKHFRHKREVTFDDQHATLRFAFGVAELSTRAGELVIDAYAHTPADLERLQHVVGSHLERFGRRDELTVAWA
jgi:catechol 2,3-dioxygenase